MPSGCKGKGSFRRGIHPRGNKQFSEDAAIAVLPVPKQVDIALSQHIGAPCKPVVASRDEVAPGDMVGDVDSFIAAPVHASIAGKVARESVATLPNGQRVKTLPIKAGEEQPSDEELLEDVYGGNWSTAAIGEMDPKDIANKVRDAGIVGHGGAAFPTFVKLLRNKDKPVDTLLVNGCECEPFLTADQRLMQQAPAPIISGAMIAARAAGASQVVVAIENNKPAAIAAMRKQAEGTPVKIAVVKTRYPMGGEKQTVKAVLNRKIPTGGLPLDIGVVVINVATAAAIARAVLRGKPVTHRIVSVSGAGIAGPKNLLAPIGASYQDLIDHCGGLGEHAARVVSGGPMMGFAVGDLTAPITKGTSGIVVLTKADVARSRETACVRCGRCVDVCPLNLVPSKMAMAARNEDWELAQKYQISACMECGCCAYTCPASIPLVQLVRVGKNGVESL